MATVTATEGMAVVSPLRFSVTGLVAGETVADASREVVITIESGEAERVSVALDDGAAIPLILEPYVYRLFTTTLPVGRHLLTINVEGADGTTAAQEIEFFVAGPTAAPTTAAPLPTQMTAVTATLLPTPTPTPGPLVFGVMGMVPGEALLDTPTRSISVQPIGQQSPYTSVEFALDDQPIITLTEPPFAVDLDLSVLVAGRHLLSIQVANAAGETAVRQIEFFTGLPTATPSGDFISQNLQQPTPEFLIASLMLLICCILMLVVLVTLALIGYIIPRFTRPDSESEE